MSTEQTPAWPSSSTGPQTLRARWVAEARRILVGSVWRLGLTFLVALSSLALPVYFASTPGVSSWIGPVSQGFAAAWLVAGFVVAWIHVTTTGSRSAAA